MGKLGHPFPLTAIRRSTEFLLRATATLRPARVARVDLIGEGGL